MASPDDILRLKIEITNPNLLKNLKADIIKKVKLELAGKGFDQLSKLKSQGLAIKTKLNLGGADFNKLMKLQKEGITIPVKFKDAKGVGTGTAIRRLRSGGTGSTSQQELNEREVTRLNTIAEKATKERRKATDRKLQVYEEARINAERAQAKAALDAQSQIEKQAIEARKSQLSRQSLQKQLNRQEQLRVQQAEREAVRAKKLNDKSAAAQTFLQESEAIAARSSQLSAQRLRDANDLQARRDAAKAKAEALAAGRIARGNTSRALAAQKAQQQAQAQTQNGLTNNSLLSSSYSTIAQSNIQINSANKLLAKTNPNKPKQPISPKDLENSAIAGLLGLSSEGNPALGVLKGATAFAGGIAGSYNNPGGAAKGALVATAVLDIALASFGRLTEVLRKAAEAGLSFERSILGIASVLQATSTVRTKSGNSLGLTEQLTFQQGEAKKIQTAARSRLLPIGIAGEREATLVQAIISGAGQRGIQLNAEEAATLAERLGGAIQAQRPELLNNSSQLRRDIEDLLSGLPNRTVLGSLVKSYAPNIGKSNTAEELLRNTKGLSSFPVSLRNSTDNPVTVLNKLDAALDQITTTFGDTFNRTLLPGLNALADSLLKPELVNSLKEIAGLIGQITSNLALAAAAMSEALNLISGGINALANIPGLISTQGDNSQEGELKRLKVMKSIAGSFLDPKTAEKVNVRISALESILEPNTSQVSKNVQISNISRQLGVESSLDEIGRGTLKEDPEGQLRLLQRQRALIPQALGENIAKSPNQESVVASIKDALLAQVGNNLLTSQSLRDRSEERSGLFNTNSPIGQLNLRKDQLPFIQKEKGIAEENLSDALKYRDLAVKSAKSDDDIVEANRVVRKASQELIKVRQQERDAIDELKEAELSRSKVLRDSIFDPGTASGRLALASSAEKDATDRGSLARERVSALQAELAKSALPVDRKNVNSQIEAQLLKVNAAEIDRTAAARARQEAVLDNADLSLQASSVIRDFNTAVKEAGERFRELGVALSESKRRLEDFDADKALRNQDRQSKLIKEFEDALANTDNNFTKSAIEAKIPEELRGLVKGSFGFSELRREKFDKDRSLNALDSAVRENSKSRFSEDEANTKQALQEQQARLEREKEDFPAQLQRIRLDALKNVINLRNQGVDVPGGEEFIQKRAKELGIDGSKLEAFKKAQTVEIAQATNVQKITNYIKAILDFISGGQSEKLVQQDSTNPLRTQDVPQSSEGPATTAQGEITTPKKPQSGTIDALETVLKDSLEVQKSILSILSGIDEIIKNLGGGSLLGSTGKAIEKTFDPVGTLKKDIGGFFGGDKPKSKTAGFVQDFIKKGGKVKSDASGMDEAPFTIPDSEIENPTEIVLGGLGTAIGEPTAAPKLYTKEQIAAVKDQRMQFGSDLLGKLSGGIEQWPTKGPKFEPPKANVELAKGLLAAASGAEAPATKEDFTKSGVAPVRAGDNSFVEMVTLLKVISQKLDRSNLSGGFSDALRQQF